MTTPARGQSTKHARLRLHGAKHYRPRFLHGKVDGKLSFPSHEHEYIIVLVPIAKYMRAPCALKTIGVVDGCRVKRASCGMHDIKERALRNGRDKPRDPLPPFLMKWS